MTEPVRMTSTKLVDYKGEPLVAGAWYFLCDEEEDLKTGNGPILQWTGAEFVDESGDGEPADVHDAGLGNGMLVAGYQFAVRQS